MTIERVDINADGEKEIIVENEYLRMRISNPQSLGQEKYGVRFVWGGLVEGITFLPTAKKYFRPLEQRRNDEDVVGIPEEFEVQDDLGYVDGKHLAHKIGIGLGEGDPRLRDTYKKLLELYPWKYEKVSGAKGRVTLRFTQESRVINGKGYKLVREIVVRDKSSSVAIRNRLKNIGQWPLETEWFTHNAYGWAEAWDESWYQYPIRVSSNGKFHVLNESATIPGYQQMKRWLWGWQDRHELGPISFYAVGNHKTGDILTVSSDTSYKRVRVCTSNIHYFPEPMIDVSLAPGEEKAWEFAYFFAKGLSRLSGCGVAGAMDVSLNTKGNISVKAATSIQAQSVKYSLNIEQNEKKVKSYEGVLSNCSPLGPVETELDFPFPPGIYEVSGTLSVPGEEPVRIIDTLAKETVFPTARIRPVRGENKILIVSSTFPKRRSLDEFCLIDALLHAGFTFEKKTVAELEGLNEYASVFCFKAESIAPEKVRLLQDYVRNGGGLVWLPPFPFETEGIGDLLPVVSAPDKKGRKTTSADGWAWANESDDVARSRISLKAVTAHPIIDELALYPGTYQYISKFHRLDPKEKSSVLLNYYTRMTLRGQSRDYPALVIGQFGKGRIAVFGSDISWGMPAHFIVWSGFGNFHRKLLAQMMLWTAGCIE